MLFGTRFVSQKSMRTDYEVIFVDKTSKERTTTRIGAGFCKSVSFLNDKTILLLLKKFDEDQNPSSLILLSTNLGFDWYELEKFPKAVEGLSFYSKSNGYVWSVSGLYFTKDAGESWVRIYSGPMNNIVDDGKAVISGKNNDFWIPFSRYGDYVELGYFKDNTLVQRLKLSPRITAIFEMAISPDNSLFFLGQERNSSDILVFQISTMQSVPKGIKRFTSNAKNQISPGFFGFVGSDLVLVISHIAGITTEQEIFISKNEGKEWHKIKVAGLGAKHFIFQENKEVWYQTSWGELYKTSLNY
ncbi:MAG: hypothetical protein JNJ47_07140 [Alphaproteobacteria bacterium]|nr:hypothetical protein [Alphaproteobacteria bacterium]